MLLQYLLEFITPGLNTFCSNAVTNLVAKLHRNDEQFALAGTVSLNGLRDEISSGEELLKTWVLLSNIGHAQYTYGVEKALLQQAIELPDVRAWLTDYIRPTDLRNWAGSVIDRYVYSDFRYLLTMMRVAQLPPRDRRKGRFTHYLRNLLLPLPRLFPEDSAARHKLRRLRNLYARIRLLSMVTLDAHYSHHPISINLNSAILGLADLLPSQYRDSGFDQVLQNAAGWLADELYLHPLAVSAQRAYELRFATRFPRRFEEASNAGRLPVLFNDLMTQGLGPPRTQDICHLVRLSFPTLRRQLLGMSTPYATIRQLEKELAGPPMTSVSIDTNSVTRMIHVDFIYRRDPASLVVITRLYAKLYKWLLRVFEADSLARIRRIYSGPRRADSSDIQIAKQRDLARQIDRLGPVLQGLFESVIRFLLPENRKFAISDFAPSSYASTPILAKLIFADGSIVDTATPRFREILDENIDVLPADRLHEVRSLEHVFKGTSAPFILACLEKFTIRDLHGKAVDEWDGVMVELSEQGIALTVVEAKSGGAAEQRENQAFRQLDATRRLMRARHPLQYRRSRIPRMGAAIRFYSDA